MLKFIINISELKHYVGILSKEKHYKNTINIICEYYLQEDVFIDYSFIYDDIINIVFSKNWDYIENLAKTISESIMKKYEHIEKIKIKVEKLNPLKMKYSSSISVEYEKQK